MDNHLTERLKWAKFNLEAKAKAARSTHGRSIGWIISMPYAKPREVVECTNRWESDLIEVATQYLEYTDLLAIQEVSAKLQALQDHAAAAAQYRENMLASLAPSPFVHLNGGLYETACGASWSWARTVGWSQSDKATCPRCLGILNA